jgi:uncharacterized membrane protein
MQGWRCFAKDPAIWVVTALFYLVLIIALNWIPVVGPVAAALVGPALLGGLVWGAREVDRGHDLEVSHLFQAFRNGATTGPMLILGLVPAGVTVLLGTMILVLVGSATGAGLITGSEATAVGVLAGGGLLVGLGFLLSSVVTVAALLYAIPLVMFDHSKPASAIITSLKASFANLVPLLVLGLIYLILLFLATIPLGLGLLVLVPVTAGTVYTSYKCVCEDRPSQPVLGE